MQAINAFRSKTIPLAHGTGAIPVLGFGTLIRDPVAAKQAIKAALETGYRLLDGAEL